MVFGLKVATNDDVFPEHCTVDMLGRGINVIYGDAAHDRDAAHPWQPLHNQMYT